MEKKRGSHCQSEVSSTGTLKKKKKQRWLSNHPVDSVYMDDEIIE